jgi:hypothetical protein|nr:MAG TPA: hypothetical protein [Caudoviricetes sp.]
MNELKETVELMLSNDYKERFKAEYYQLKIRIDRLDNMLSKMENDELNFIPTCSCELLQNQLKAMLRYQASLKERAEVEKIDLED